MPKVKKRKLQASKAVTVRQVRAITIRQEPLPAEAIEKVLLQGDLSSLTVEQRLQYYKSLCQSLGLNPLTKPFDYLSLSGKLVLYAKRDCTDQLRKIYGVSVTHLETKTEDGMCIAKVEVRDKNGRTDAASGAVWVEPLKALDLANAIMKAETKAKRRATLSICGMGMLDESELDTIQDKHFLTDGGRIIHEPEQHDSKAAAQAVAERKIAEHAARQSENKTQTENATGSPQANVSPNVAPSLKEGQQKPAMRQETVSLTPWKEGLVALSGPGLSILRSEMATDDRAFFGIKNDGGVFCLEEKLIFKFQDLCTRLNVGYVMNEPVTAKSLVRDAKPKSNLPKAVIPPKDWEFGEQPVPAKSTDPILFEAKAIEPKGKKPFMKLKWSGGEHSCFDKGLWPILLAAIGKPVMLETKAKGQWSNLVRIVRVDGIEFGEGL